MKFQKTSLVAMFGLLMASEAHAQGSDELGSFQLRHYDESAQDSVIEARFGPYRPDVDTEVEGAPFSDTFGSKSRYAFGLEYDWQVFRIPVVGTLAPGIGWSYVRYSGKAPRADGTGPSAQNTRLWVMPFWVVGVLRVDVLARKYQIPLVPYGKFGFTYAFWSCTTANSACRNADGKLGRGTETGYQYAGGLMLLLDWLDPESAREMDNSVGVNNSYFFGEWYQSSVDSFGKGMQVGTSTWTLGLAFEF